jgi:hypothetical protein
MILDGGMPPPRTAIQRPSAKSKETTVPKEIVPPTKKNLYEGPYVSKDRYVLRTL